MDTNYVAARTDPKDLWTLHDAPHFEDVKNPRVFAAFLRSESTESVACSSMFRTIALWATGPGGGKVTLSAFRSHLEPEACAQLMAALDEARATGRFISTEDRLQKSL